MSRMLSLACVASMLPAAMAQITSASCNAADISGAGDQSDGRIGVHDMLAALAQFRCTEVSIEGDAQCTADISGPSEAPDGVVNVLDGKLQTVRLEARRSQLLRQLRL